jgi:polysaccharide pyruvyl transferase WcaK-like protein
MVGQGIGPMERPDLITIAKRVLHRIDFISLRESLHGLPLLKSLGVNLDRVVVTGDDAIELAYQRRPVVIGNNFGVNIRRASYSALSPRDLESLRAPIASIIKLLNCPVISVPVSQRPEESDSKSFVDLLDAQVDVSRGGDNITTPLQLIDQIGRCRLVIVGSYHAAVFALAQGVSAIGLAGNAYYIQKFEGLADQFGSGCEVIRFHDDGFQERLKSAAVRMWNMADEVRPHLLSRAAQQVAASKAAYESLSQKANARFSETSDQG